MYTYAHDAVITLIITTLAILSAFSTEENSGLMNCLLYTVSNHHSYGWAVICNQGPLQVQRSNTSTCTNLSVFALLYSSNI